MRTLCVGLGARGYPIHIGAGLIRDAGRLLAPILLAPRAVIVSNAVVAASWLEPLRETLAAAGITSDAVLVPDGESHKTLQTLDAVITRLIELRAERTTTVIALGGGVVGDIAGFAAATYLRGVPLAQVPTTLLAQVDSSVGGKTGVNHPLGKNLIGAFYQPGAVLIDPDCLRTLPERELNAGLAEVVKYGAIRDRSFFEWLEQNMDRLLARDPEALAHAIERSCAIKADVVAADERESGVRALLNFGHTFGHAIEAGAGYGRWLHGEAVAAGMVMAARLSVRLGTLQEAEASRLREVLRRARLPIEGEPLGADRYLELMGRDKKVAAGAIRFVLLRGIGDAHVTSDVPASQLTAILP